ncbi:MAG TPA: energy transducer TonB [Kofleriaceae bacterium]|nr:energy transducer TonB [Kofleriaceae bacterium]
MDLRAPNPPAPAPEGGPQVAQAEAFKKKDSQKKVIKELRQPDEVKATEDKPPTTATDGGGSGSATGPGTGSGDPTSTGTCTENCGPPEKKPEVIEDDPCKLNPHSCDPIILPPPLIRGLRISGETQIQPPDIEKTALLRSGNSRATATAKVCIDERGNPTTLSLFKASGYDGWDAKIIGAMRNWRYKPYKVGTRSVTVCGMVTFVYEIH